MPSTRACPSLPILHRLYKTRAPKTRLWHSRSWLACFAAAALALAGGSMGCGTTTRFTPLNPSPHPLQARPAAAVEVYSTGLPARPYTEVGLIQGTQSSEYSSDDMPEIITAMRAEAGRVGCDALILNGPNTRSTSAVGTLPGENQVNLQGFWGTCITFMPTAAPVAVQPPPPAPPQAHSAPPAPLAAPAPAAAPAPVAAPAPSAPTASASQP